MLFKLYTLPEASIFVTPTSPTDRPFTSTGYSLPLYVSLPPPQLIPTPAATKPPLNLSVASGVFAASSARATVRQRPSAAIVANPIIHRMRILLLSEVGRSVAVAAAERLA